MGAVPGALGAGARPLPHHPDADSRRGCKQAVVTVLLLPLFSSSLVSKSLRLYGLQPSWVLYPRDFPGKNTGVGNHFLLQGIFPTQGSNPCLLHCRQILYHGTTREDLVMVLEGPKSIRPWAHLPGAIICALKPTRKQYGDASFQCGTALAKSCA